MRTHRPTVDRIRLCISINCRMQIITYHVIIKKQVSINIENVNKPDGFLKIHGSPAKNMASVCKMRNNLYVKNSSSN